MVLCEKRTGGKSTALVALCAATVVFCGCEDDHPEHATWNGNQTQPAVAAKAADGTEQPAAAATEPVSESIVGVWKLSGAGGTWYAHFGSDGTWKISDDAEGSARRVYGNYTVSGGSFKGDMENPGVGEGEISGTFQDGTMAMDFVEHWHTPYKHVAYTGPKL